MRIHTELDGAYGSGNKPGVTLASILHVSLSDLAAFQKIERRHVKQGVVTSGVQLLSQSDSSLTTAKLQNLTSFSVLLISTTPTHSDSFVQFSRILPSLIDRL